MERLLEAEAPEGILDPFEGIVVTDAHSRFPAPSGRPWFSLSVINDGPSSIFAIVNEGRGNIWHEVRNGETYNVDMHRGRIKDVVLYCATGLTSTARMVCAR